MSLFYTPPTSTSSNTNSISNANLQSDLNGLLNSIPGLSPSPSVPSSASPQISNMFSGGQQTNSSSLSGNLYSC